MRYGTIDMSGRGEYRAGTALARSGAAPREARPLVGVSAWEDIVAAWNEVNDQLHALGAQLATDIGVPAATLLLAGAPVSGVAANLFAPGATAEQRVWFAAVWAPFVFEWNAFAQVPIQVRIAQSGMAPMFLFNAVNEWKGRLFDMDKAARDLRFKITIPPPTPKSESIVARVEHRIEAAASSVWDTLGSMKTVALVGLGVAGVAMLAFIVKEATSK